MIICRCHWGLLSLHNGLMFSQIYLQFSQNSLFKIGIPSSWLKVHQAFWALLLPTPGHWTCPQRSVLESVVQILGERPRHGTATCDGRQRVVGSLSLIAPHWHFHNWDFERVCLEGWFYLYPSFLPSPCTSSMYKLAKPNLYFICF